MRPSGRRGTRWNSILFLLRTQCQSGAESFSIAGKLDEADAAGRKVAELQPSAASSHRWQVLVAVQRGDRRDGLARSATGARRRLSPFRTRARTTRTRRSQGSRRGFSRPHRQWPRSIGLSNRRGLRRARRERQSVRMVANRVR